MATVRSTCWDCGNVELTTKDVHVRICEDTNAGTYSFTCPDCQMTVIYPCEIRTVDLLVASGVSFEYWKLPEDLFEQHSGDPINHDDLIDLHEVLVDDEAFTAELQGLLNP